MDGKRRLGDAIASESVEKLRDALLFLLTTPLARRADENETNGASHRWIIDVDVLVTDSRRNPQAFENTTTTTVLAAAVGPKAIHTEMVRCLMTPQVLTVHHNNTDNKDSGDGVDSSSSTVVTITTNAKERLLERKDPLTGTTPLALSCYYSNRNLTKFLLEHGARPECLSRGGVRLLTMACLQSRHELVRTLLEHGADPNACGNDGITPLIRAARSGNLELVELLLLPLEDESDNCGDKKTYSSGLHRNQWGTDVCRYDQQSMNALIHACAENEEAVVRFLASGGNGDNRASSSAIAKFVNDYKVDPALWYASAHGNATIVRFLMDECGARASYRKNPAVYSSTPLEEASQWGHASTVSVLLERLGSDPRTPSGQKARVQAERSGHSKVVELLDGWRNHSETIEAASFSMGILPLVLSKRPNSVHRILCNHAGGLFGRKSRGDTNGKPGGTPNDDGSTSFGRNFTVVDGFANNHDNDTSI